MTRPACRVCATIIVYDPDPSHAGIAQLFDSTEAAGTADWIRRRLPHAVAQTMAGPEYRAASDAAKHVLLTQAVDLAHKAAKFEFARDQMLATSDPANVSRAALVGLSTLDKPFS